MDVKNTVRYTKLLDVYGALLTNKQCSILTDYLCYNNTLSEIAQTHNTTRQAVNDIIIRSVAKLDELENKLGFCKKLEEIKLGLKECEKELKHSELKQKMDNILKIMEE